MKFIALICIFLLSSCASYKPFSIKNTSTDFGYQVIATDKKEIFKINASIESDLKGEYSSKYLFRAVGETCLLRGFEFFDIGEQDATQVSGPMLNLSVDGYCLKTNQRKGLSITFKNAPENTYDSKVLVEDLNNKSNSQLKVSDYINDIEGQKINSVSEIKRIVYQNIDTKKSLRMTIVRDSKKININEPIITMIGFHYGPEFLKSLRSSVK